MSNSFFSLPKQNPFNFKQEIIFVLGGPGSGKGTHCRHLRESKGYCHISTGDLVRRIINDSKNPETRAIREAVRRGELLDDQLITDILKHEMALHPRAAGFLIDGFPRTLRQLQLFESQLKPCDKVLYFDITEAIMKQRVLKRGTLENREDDNEITAARRIQVYNEKTLPLVHYLEKNRPVIFNRIDSSGPIEEVSRLVDDVMANFSLNPAQSDRGSGRSSSFQFP